MQCELCQKEHDGSYGSGRFCSKKCARAFSTHHNRKTINEKVSQKLFGRLRKINPEDKRLFPKVDQQRLVDVERLKAVLPQASSWTMLAAFFNLQRSGGRIAILKRTMIEAGIDVEEATKHFKRFRTPQEILTLRPDEPKGHLREALIKIGRTYVCEFCGLGPSWHGKNLTLHVDHINGTPYDHRPENLRFLCPNCHSQTDTFSWKNARRKQAA